MVSEAVQIASLSVITYGELGNILETNGATAVFYQLCNIMNPHPFPSIKQNHMIQKNRFPMLIVALLFVTHTFAQTTTAVKPFDKIIVSPHIQVTFLEGSEESVSIESSTVDTDKIHIEVKDKTLRVYLEGAKDIEKNEKDYRNGYKEKHSLYQGKVVTAVITYKTLHQLSIRGDEKQLCKSAITGDKFVLRVYGESDVVLNEVKVNKLVTATYGECHVTFLSGAVTAQRYTAYGEGDINSVSLSGRRGAITAYGEADFKMNVSDEIKITAFGEAKVRYKGSPVIRKGLNIGEVHIEKLN